jgi:DNA modification methylase
VSEDVRIFAGDCRSILPMLESASVDCVITDPPYPEIDRPYGRMTEAEWHAMMDAVVPECRRVLKPTGSAVFILQPNSERVGRMRPWLWEFMAKWTRDWGMVQDAWWWNINSPPTVHCHRKRGLARPSLKACVWLGPEDCHRDQDAVLMAISDSTLADKRVNDDRLQYSPSGYSGRFSRKLSTCRDRSGVVPFNVLPMGHGSGGEQAGDHGHGAGTPFGVADWWTRYICPPGGTVLDPFMGSGTMGLAALARRRKFVGIERMPEYFAIAERRLAEPPMPLFAPTLPPIAETETPLFR